MGTGTVRGAWRGVEAAGKESTRRPVAGALFRSGYFARGAVYAVIGTLALRLAIGRGGKTTDTKGALATLAEAPLAEALLVALAVGFAGLALWFWVQAVFDPDGERRSGAWAVLSRVGQAAGGFGYASLAFAAVQIAIGESAGAAGNEAARTWTARALALPAGRVLVFVGAAIAIFVGGRQIWTGARREFLKHLDAGATQPPLRAWTVRLGTAGFVTQGVVFLLVGLFFAQAAFEREPHEATGFDGALAVIARQPFGMALLAAVALGLLSYAAFSVIEGRHRRIAAP